MATAVTMIRVIEVGTGKSMYGYKCKISIFNNKVPRLVEITTNNSGFFIVKSDVGSIITVIIGENNTIGRVIADSTKEYSVFAPKVVVTPCGAIYRKNSTLGLHTVILGSKAKMYPIWRSGDELFSKTVADAQKKDKLDVVINGVWFGGRLGIYAIAAAHSSMPSSETYNEGLVVINEKKYGTPSPERYVNQDKNGQFSVGDGDPSSTAYMAVDGLCALIMNSLKYGIGNKYSKKDLQNPIVDKSPKPEHIKYLTQRNSDKLAALMYEDNSVGKVGFGITKSNAVIVIVQEHDADGISYPQLQNLFIENNCIHAFVLDGSDSVLLNYKGKNLVQAGIVKNKLQVSGIGFKHEC